MVKKWKLLINGNDKTENKYRIAEIDMAKGIGILLVILGHMEKITSNVWKQFAASFHMPLFFVLSGLLYSQKDYSMNDFRQFVSKKAKHILVPYILWALIYSNGVSLKNIIYIFYANNKVFAEAGLWFLPTFFVAECTYYLIKWLTSKTKPFLEPCLIILCAILSYLLDTYPINPLFKSYGYPFSIDIALTATVFIATGAWGKSVFLSLKGEPTNQRTNSILLFGGGMICFAVVYLISRINYGFINDHAFERVVMARASYGCYPLFIVGAIIGSVAVCILALLLKKSKLLQYIGKNSLLYMCSNHFVISIIMTVTEFFRPDFGGYTNLERILISFFLLFIITAGCTILSWIINRFVPVLTGKTS